MNVPPGWDLPDGIRKRLGAGCGRQRAMLADDHLLLVLHAAPTPGDSNREGVYFWRRPDGEWAFSGLRGVPRDQLKAHAQRFSEEVDRLDELYDRADGARDYMALLQGTGPLQRAAQHLYETLQAAREAVPEDPFLIDMRDRAYEVARAAELLHQDARNALDCALMERTEAQARTSHALAIAGHRLNILAALFLPMTAVSSVFGMNLPSGLQDAPAWLFWLVLGCSLLLGVVLLGILSGGPKALRFGRPNRDETSSPDDS